jgi:hypothetical protein
VAILLEFDAGNNILRGTLEGEMTRATLLDFYSTIARYTESHPPCRGIGDFSGVTESRVSSDDIRQLVAAPPLFPAGYMRVLVLPTDSVYGMGRMYQILAEKSRPELHVVRSMEEAYRLLQVKTPEFLPL